jgi:hypothetical protein
VKSTRRRRAESGIASENAEREQQDAEDLKGLRFDLSAFRPNCEVPSSSSTSLQKAVRLKCLRRAQGSNYGPSGNVEGCLACWGWRSEPCSLCSLVFKQLGDSSFRCILSKTISVSVAHDHGHQRSIYERPLQAPKGTSKAAKCNAVGCPQPPQPLPMTFPRGLGLSCKQRRTLCGNTMIIQH